MKKIFTSVAVIAACAVGAFAQKNVDLEIRLLSPLNNSTYDNFVNGEDTIPFFYEITNNGTANIVPGDTIIFNYEGSFYGGTSNSKYSLTQEMNEMSLAAGAKDTLGFLLIQGDTIGTNSTNGEPIIVKFPHNAHDTLSVFAFGIGADGNLFTDPGIDPVANTVGGNNIDAAALVFGTPTSLKNIFANKAEVLNVYPNPTNGNVNVKHALSAASEVSVKVTDIAGRAVYTQNYGKQAAGEQTFNMNLAHLANGVYSVELTAGSQRATSKFTIKK